MKPTALSQVRQGNVVGFNFTAPAKVRAHSREWLQSVFRTRKCGGDTGRGCKRPRILEDCKHTAHDALDQDRRCGGQGQAVRVQSGKA
jgi:hypothetical protein